MSHYEVQTFITKQNCKVPNIRLLSHKAADEEELSDAL